MTENMEVLAAGILHYIPTLLGIAVGFLWNKVQSLRKNRALIEASQRTILKYNLWTMYNEFAVKGEINLGDEELAEEIYERYHDLGGNGQATQIIADIRKLLKPKPKEESC